MPTDKSKDAEVPDPAAPLSTPYGPHPGPIDDASGGADSSPFETLSSDERAKRLAAGREGKEPSEADVRPRH